MAASGLNAGGIEKIKKAIVDYKKAIDNTKDAYVASKTTIEKAFKGANVTNIQALAKDIDTSINTYTAEIMKVFETYTNDLKTKYKSQDTSASAVSNVRQSIKS